MRKVPLIALAVLGLFATQARAVDIKNLRSVYGPFGGIRADNKLLPGDILLLAYDVADLVMDPASGLVKYKVRLAVYDSAGKEIFKRDTPNQRYLSLGKGLVSDRAQVFTGNEQKPGKYTVKLTVTDEASKAKDSKEVSYSFELLPPGFGLIHFDAPSVAGPNYDYKASMAVVGMARDPKTMLPSLQIKMSILDESGKPTLSQPILVSIPKDLPAEFDVKKVDFIGLPFPVTLNRPGRFTIEIEATDLLSKKSAKVSFPLQVLETGTAGK